MHCIPRQTKLPLGRSHEPILPRQGESKLYKSTIASGRVCGYLSCNLLCAVFFFNISVKNVLLFLDYFLLLTLWRPLIGRFRSMWNDAHFPFWIHLTFGLTFKEQDRNSPWHVYLRKIKFQLNKNSIQLTGKCAPWVPNLILAIFMPTGWKRPQQGGFNTKCVVFFLATNFNPRQKSSGQWFSIHNFL